MKCLHRNLWILVLLLGSGEVRAENYYSQRLHISEVEVVDRTRSPDVTDEALIRSLFDFVLELRSFYSEKQRVWLGRDGELGYDIDWLLWQRAGSDPAIEPLLINVSRKSQASELLFSYLQNHGFDRDASGRRVFVDTGYEGSVIDAINRVLNAQGISDVPAHLISSIHTKSPSSRLATRSYLPEDLKSKTTLEKEAFLDLVQTQVDGIEDLPHSTTSCTGYASVPSKPELIDATSKDQDPEEVAKSEQVQRQVRRFFAEQSDFVDQMMKQTSALTKFITDIKKQTPTKEDVTEIHKYIKQNGLGLWWLDLREAFAKGTLDVPSTSMQAIWKYHPKGVPPYFDLEPKQEDDVLAQEAKRMGSTLAKTQLMQTTLVEQILAFHKTEKVLVKGKDRERSRIYEGIQQVFKSGSFILSGKSYAIDQNKLGEGARGDVFALGEDFILKVPFELDSMRYFVVEQMVQRDLEEHFDQYHIRTLPIIAFGERGQYLIRRKLPKDAMGEEIAKGELSPLQMKKLEDLYNHAVIYARTTGVGLDIKFDNVAWINDDWILFDAGPRTSYGPYAFTLDIPNFETFYKLWKEDTPRKDGLSIDAVVETINAGGCSDVF